MSEKKYPIGEYVVSSSLMVVRSEDAKIIFNGSGNLMMPEGLSTDFDETVALAHLFASAPDILKALEDLKEQITQVSDGDRPYTGFDTEMIDAAIAKAHPHQR